MLVPLMTCSIRVETPNRIEEWHDFFSEFFEPLDERPFAHTSMMFLFPRDHSEGMSLFEPSVGDELNSPVTGDEDAVVLRRISARRRRLPRGSWTSRARRSNLSHEGRQLALAAGGRARP